MNTSILLLCNNNEHFVPSFYKSILTQTSELAELIILFSPEANQSSIHEAKALQEIAPFTIRIHQCATNNELKQYKYGLEIAKGDILLFARPQHNILPNKIKEFKRFIDLDPLFKLVFTNIEVVNQTGDVVIPDYFGLSGFYERWDYYKKLSSILTKQVGFIQDFQMGIPKKTSEQLLSFLNEYPTLETELSFSELISIFVAIKFPYPNAIKEIPYVLNQYQLTNSEITQIQAQKRVATHSISEKQNWLNSYKAITTLLDNQHDVLKQIDQNLSRLEKRKAIKASNNKFSALAFLLGGHYKKQSFDPFTDFKQDIS